MIKRKPFIVLTLLLLTLVFAGSYYVFATHQKSIPKGYSEVKDYNHVEPGELTCMAVLPACGYCPGEVISNSCYVNKSEAN